MDSVDLAFLPALEQAKLIRQRQISPLELVQLYLKRIDQLDTQLGSYVHVAAEAAIADATAKTATLMQGDADELPPFFGVTISIKDLNPVADMPWSAGIKFIKNRIATEDDGTVQRLRQAGFVLLGKTATSQLGMLPYTEPEGFPPVRNPWHLDYTPGGSSGGAAAALAAGLCSISQGSDGGGSIRGPAACCGLVGLKPSRGRVTMAPYGDRLSGIATNGPIGRTVADTAALLDVMSGYVAGDPYWLPPPSESFLAACSRALAPLRIAYATEILPIGAADPLCQQAVQEAVHLLTQMGHTVEPGCPDVEGLIEPFVTVWQAILSESRVPEFVLGKMNRWLRTRSRFVSCGGYLRAVSAMQKISRRIVQFFDAIDVLVLPVYLHPPIRVGEWATLRPAKTLEKIINWVAPCPPFNATGQPAISLPMGFTPDGLPIGVQFVGRPGAETTLIALAAQLEAAKPWLQHRPAIATNA